MSVCENVMKKYHYAIASVPKGWALVDMLDDNDPNKAKAMAWDE
jgi:hypothetical protein